MGDGGKGGKRKGGVGGEGRGGIYYYLRRHHARVFRKRDALHRPRRPILVFLILVFLRGRRGGFAGPGLEAEDAVCELEERERRGGVEKRGYWGGDEKGEGEVEEGED